MIDDPASATAPLAEHIAPGSSLVRVWELKGGISARTIAFELRLPDGSTSRFVARCLPTDDDLRLDLDASGEFRLLRALYAAGVPVPRPLLHEAWNELLQAAVIVVEYIDGDCAIDQRDVGHASGARSVALWSARTWLKESAMSDERAVPETRGVTVELLATVDLGPEIEGLAGRQLRMRMVRIAPGGVFGPLHDHKDRPGIVYVLQGTITDHRDGVSTEYGPGVGWPEDKNTLHWLENRGTTPAVEVSVDIVRQE